MDEGMLARGLDREAAEALGLARQDLRSAYADLGSVLARLDDPSEAGSVAGGLVNLATLIASGTRHVAALAGINTVRELLS